jgi:hypothetical protein
MREKTILSTKEFNTSIILNLLKQKRDLKFERLKLVEQKRNTGKLIYNLSLKIDSLEKEIEKKLEP